MSAQLFEVGKKYLARTYRGGTPIAAEIVTGGAVMSAPIPGHWLMVDLGAAPADASTPQDLLAPAFVIDTGSPLAVSLLQATAEQRAHDAREQVATGLRTISVSFDDGWFDVSYSGDEDEIEVESVKVGGQDITELLTGHAFDAIANATQVAIAEEAERHNDEMRIENREQRRCY